MYQGVERARHEAFALRIVYGYGLEKRIEVSLHLQALSGAGGFSPCLSRERDSPWTDLAYFPSIVSDKNGVDAGFPLTDSDATNEVDPLTTHSDVKKEISVDFPLTDSGVKNAVGP